MPTGIFLLKYMTTWVSMTAAVVVLLMLSEAAYGFLLMRFTGRDCAEIVHPLRSIAVSVVSPVLLPACACKPIAIIMPMLAVAALFPVCSSLPFFTFSPLIDNGADMLQIIHFTILSEVFAVIAIYSLGTEYAFRSATRQFSEFIKLLVVLVAAFSSFAVYFAALGVQGNPFSLDVYTLSLQFKSLGWLGRAAAAVFVFLAFWYSPRCEESETGDVLTGLPLGEYSGIQRAILQIWAAFKAFIIATLVTHIFFPWFLFKESEKLVAGSYTAQAVTFTAFALTVILVRVFGVMICRNIRSLVEKKLPAQVVTLLIMLLIGIAMGVIYHEAYLTALEAY